MKIGESKKLSDVAGPDLANSTLYCHANFGFWGVKKGGFSEREVIHFVFIRDEFDVRQNFTKGGLV